MSGSQSGNIINGLSPSFVFQRIAPTIYVEGDRLAGQVFDRSASQARKFDGDRSSMANSVVFLGTHQNQISIER
jgi:hypothetical protein